MNDHNVIQFVTAAARIKNKRLAMKVIQAMSDKTKWCPYIRHQLPIGRSCEACDGCCKRGA